jgi:hypothetical protein
LVDIIAAVSEHDLFALETCSYVKAMPGSNVGKKFLPKTTEILSTD